MSPAAAQDAQAVAAAETLFGDARALMAKNDFAGACPKLEESERLAPAVGTLLNLGVCYEKSGRNASAWATFKEAVSAARAGNQNDREQFARSHANALEEKISKLTIHVPTSLREATGLTVRRDGIVVARAAWDTAMPLDAGPHRIDVAADGRRSWSTTVTIADGSVGIDADVPDLPRIVVAKARTAVVSSSSDEAPAYGAQRTIGLVIAGVGVAGIAAGTVFGSIAKSKNDDALTNHCNGGNVCDAEGLTLTNEARDSATAATVSFAAGGVALISGAVLFFTAPKRVTRASLHASPTVIAHGAGFSFGGTW